MKNLFIFKSTKLLFGFVLLSWLIFFTPIFNLMAFSGPIVPCGIRSTLDPDDPTEYIENSQCELGDLIPLVSNIIFFLIENIAIPVAVIAFVWAGWLYLTAGGNPGQLEQAHKIFKYVIFGLLLALSAWLLVNGILNALLDPKTATKFNPLDSVK